MNSRKRLIALGGCVLLGLASLASADKMTGEEAALRAKMAAMEARIAELEGRQQQTWLNERRAEEIKGLVREVLADADTRASLLENGMSAGHDGNFFLASDDGSFLMKVGGQIQVRALWNYDDGRTADRDDFGMQIRRAKLWFKGHVADPKINYMVRLATDYADGNVFLDDAKVSYDGLMDGLTISAGKFKLPFLREELVGSDRQLAVERSSFNELFTLNRAEQVQVVYTQDMWKLAVAFSDGSNSEVSDLGADAVEIALTARADIKIMGEWDQANDFSAWSGEETAVFIGGAIHWQLDDGSQPTSVGADYLALTIDGSLEMQGLNVYAAFVYADIDFDAAGVATLNPYGFLVQGGYMVIPDKLEPFVRFEYVDYDITGADELMVLTFGANYYLNKHNAKFTADLVWIIDGTDLDFSPAGADPTSTGLGLIGGKGTSVEDQFALRAQFQLLF